MDKKMKPTQTNADETTVGKETPVTEETVTADVCESDEVVTKEPVSDEAGTASETAANEPREADAFGQDSYTLTAEEFAAAKAHIEALQKEKDETVQLLQRIQADFDNFRRRNTGVRLESYEEGKRDCIKELLPVLDSFDRAIESAEADDKSLKDGVLLVQRQMVDALKKLGLAEIEAEGQFDPNFHEAIMQEKAEKKESGEILQVLQKGYRVGDKIVRHCMVKVAE